MTSGRRLCELIVRAKLLKKDYVKELRKRYTSYTDNRVLCADDVAGRNACIATRGHIVSLDQTCLRDASWRVLDD